MGREIRRVPENWEHPKRTCPHLPPCEGYECYQPIYDEDYETAIEAWMEDYWLWKKGEHPDQQKGYCKDCSYTDWNGEAPQSDSYHPKWESAEWYQMYETVSAGTPVSPAFATKEELIEYLVEYGDYWDQLDGTGGWTRKGAVSFVNSGFAPSLIMRLDDSGAHLLTPRDQGELDE